MSSTNRGGKRRKDDYYPTPAWAIPPILRQVPKGCRVLDVGCGEGAILRALLADGHSDHKLTGIELDEARADACRRGTGVPVFVADFLTYRAWGRIDAIIGNPPFTHAEAFARRAIEVVAPQHGTVALLLRLSFLETAKRVAFNTEHPADVYVLSARPSFTGDGHSDSCAYAWFVWGPGRGGRWSILDVGDLKKASSK